MTMLFSSEDVFLGHNYHSRDTNNEAFIYGQWKKPDWWDEKKQLGMYEKWLRLEKSMQCRPGTLWKWEGKQCHKSAILPDSVDIFAKPSSSLKIAGRNSITYSRRGFLQSFRHFLLYEQRQGYLLLWYYTYTLLMTPRTSICTALTMSLLSQRCFVCCFVDDQNF